MFAYTFRKSNFTMLRPRRIYTTPSVSLFLRVVRSSQCPRKGQIRTFNTGSIYHRPRDETKLSGAQHKPSLSGPSMGHLISELSATTPQMLKDGLRTEGHTMNEADRTFARRIAIALVGFPLAIGSVWVGYKWWGDWKKGERRLWWARGWQWQD